MPPLIPKIASEEATGYQPIRAPRGTFISCKGWQQEAALRMLMNNLDPEVAEKPEELIVYGGRGKAARNWESYRAIVASLKALAESYRTLSSGLYYEKPPDYLYQRELYQELKAALEEFQQAETQRQGLINTRNSDIRDALIYLTRLGAIRSNGRPKGRTFLDLIREVAPDERAKADSKIVLLS